MGHTAVAMPDGSVLLHGGMGRRGGTPLADAHLLATSEGRWTWRPVTLSTTSIRSPALAWHAATLIEGSKTVPTIVVSYGIDNAGGRASEQLYFLTQNGTSQAWAWARTLQPSLQPDAPSASTSATSLMTTVVLASATSSSAPSTRPDSPSSVVAVSRPTSAGTTDDAQGSGLSPPATRAIAGTVGAVFAVALVAGLAGVWARRRATLASDDALAKQKQGWKTVHGAPPVSALLYTRPVHRRNLSLGSTDAASSLRPLTGRSVSSSMVTSEALDFLAARTTRSSGHASEGASPPSGRSSRPLTALPLASRASTGQSVTSVRYLTSFPMRSAPSNRSRSLYSRSSRRSTSSASSGAQTIHPQVTPATPTAPSYGDLPSWLSLLPRRPDGSGEDGRLPPLPDRAPPEMLPPFAPTSPLVVPVPSSSAEEAANSIDPGLGFRIANA